MRIELYSKNLSDLRPRYENIFSPLELYPEAAFDRVRIAPESGRSRGIEIIVRRDSGRAIDWWLSYGLAYAEDSINGEMVPRLWDQRHAASFGINWGLLKGWNLNLAGTYHSGWPTTEVFAEAVVDDDGQEDFQLALGPLKGDRLPSYLRFDLRASRRFSTSCGAFQVYLEVLNLTNRKNVCCRDDFVIIENDDGSAGVDYKQGFWAPIIPSLSVSFTF